MVEDGIKSAIGAIQLIIVGIIFGIFFNTFFNAFPDSMLGPFGEVLIFIKSIPWIFAILGVLALLTMVLEVLET